MIHPRIPFGALARRRFVFDDGWPIVRLRDELTAPGAEWVRENLAAGTIPQGPAVVDGERRTTRQRVFDCGGDPLPGASWPPW